MTINDVEVRQAENSEVTVGVVSEFDIKVYEAQIFNRAIKNQIHNIKKENKI